MNAGTLDAVVEVSQPNLLQPGTTAAVFVPMTEVEWLVGELRRTKAELPGARRQRSSATRAANAGRRRKKPSAKNQRSRPKKGKARRSAK